MSIRPPRTRRARPHHLNRRCLTSPKYGVRALRLRNYPTGLDIPERDVELALAARASNVATESSRF